MIYIYGLHSIVDQMIKKYSLTLFFIISLFLKLYSQETFPIQSFPPEENNLGSQNWMITQGEEGSIYFANNKGLVRYNGAQWERFTTNNNSIMRAVKAIGKRIYSGNYMDFGYWETKSNGSLIYTSLAKELDIKILEDEQFWDIYSFNELVVFRSLNRLIIVNHTNKQVSYIPTENTLIKSFKLSNQLYFQEQGKGLFRVEKGESILVSDHPKLKTERIVQLFTRDERVMLLTEESGFFWLKGKELSPWNIQANRTLKKNTSYSAIQLNNGDFAIGTVGQGIILLDPNGEVNNIINQTNGLSNNTVLSLKEDKNQNIWLGLNNGIDVINFNSPFKEYRDTFGDLGTAYSSAEYQNQLYLGTNQGLYVKPINSNGKFRLIENTRGQVWNLTKINGLLFCGHDSGSFLISDGKATQISTINGTWLFKKHPTNTNLIFQGNYDGLHLLKKENNQWVYRNKIENFDISSRYFEFISERVLLVNHEYKGVFKIELDKTYTKATQVSDEESIEKSYNSSLISFDNDIFYFSKQGIFRFNRLSNQFEKDELTSDFFSQENYVTGKMINDEQGKLWMFSRNQIHFLSKDVFNNKLIHQSIPFDEKNKIGLSGFEHISPISGSNYLLGSNYGYFLLDINQLNTKELNISLVNISFGNQQERKAYPLDENVEVNYQSNNLLFEFTSYDYQKYENIRYQFRLKGYDSDWSDWVEETSANYSNIPFGEYYFEVRAKLGNQISKNTATKKIYISPPWYFSSISGVFYLTIILFALYFYNLYYRRKLRREQLKLMEQNKKANELKDLENQKKLIRLKNDQLKNDIESKSRELAIATMSKLKQNEFLNGLKKELETIPKEPKAKKLIKTINNKLSNNDDWEYFEKAFDNADQAFFSKLRDKHSSLSKNDLKLCAYLRLNLSSKEIAPLLNISVHSVEIKRYRLRKKMNLKRKQGIVEYIMTV